jgi:hypothetical protein
VYDKAAHRGMFIALALEHAWYNGLLNRLADYNCFVQGYADDVVILIGGNFLSTISSPGK